MFLFRSFHQLTPLHRAARRGRKDIVEYLVENRAIIDEGDGSKVHWSLSMLYDVDYVY